jgi:hypothetical protein
MNTKTPITREAAMKTGNDGKNQDIKSKFVGLHVYSCATSLVEYITLKSFEDREAPLQYDEIENLYSRKENQVKCFIQEDSGIYSAYFTDENEETILTVTPENVQLWVSTGAIEDETLNEYELFTHCQKTGLIGKYYNLVPDGGDFEEEPQDIYEWWIISTYLHDKLKEKGQPVLNDGYMHLWGRTCSGQAILLDYVITQICADMEILQGQANAWA